jgi:hypothetical protein
MCTSILESLLLTIKSPSGTTLSHPPAGEEARRSTVRIKKAASAEAASVKNPTTLNR